MKFTGTLRLNRASGGVGINHSSAHLLDGVQQVGRHRRLDSHQCALRPHVQRGGRIPQIGDTACRDAAGRVAGVYQRGRELALHRRTRLLLQKKSPNLLVGGVADILGIRYHSGAENARQQTGDKWTP